MFRRLGKNTVVRPGNVLQIASPERVTEYGLVTKVKTAGGARRISFNWIFGRKKTVMQEDLCRVGWVNVMDAAGLVDHLNKEGQRPINW